MQETHWVELELFTRVTKKRRFARPQASTPFSALMRMQKGHWTQGTPLSIKTGVSLSLFLSSIEKRGKKRKGKKRRERGERINTHDTHTRTHIHELRVRLHRQE